MVDFSGAAAPCSRSLARVGGAGGPRGRLPRAGRAAPRRADQRAVDRRRRGLASTWSPTATTACSSPTGCCGLDPTRGRRRRSLTTTAWTTCRPTSTCCSATTSRPSPAPGRWSARCWRRRWATCPARCGSWPAWCSPARCRTSWSCSSPPAATAARWATWSARRWGTVPGIIALFGAFMIMIIILAVLALVVVKALADSPWGMLHGGRRPSRSRCSWASTCATSARAASARCRSSASSLLLAAIWFGGQMWRATRPGARRSPSPARSSPGC